MYGKKLLLMIGIALVSVTTLGGCGLMSALKAESEIADGANAYDNASEKLMPHKLTTFVCGQHKFQMVPPNDFACREMEPGFGKVFMFNGKANAHGKKPVLSATILVPQENEKLPPDSSLIDLDLAPFASHMSNFVRSNKGNFKHNGIQFEGATFSGDFPDGTSLKGFVNATHYKGAGFVFFAEDQSDSFDANNSIFNEAFESFKPLD